MAEDDPTYVETTWTGLPMYLCLFDGHQAFELAPFEQHMGAFHGGVMRPAVPEPEAAAPAAVDAPQEPARPASAEPAADPEAPPETPAPADDEGV